MFLPRFTPCWDAELDMFLSPGEGEGSIVHEFCPGTWKPDAKTCNWWEICKISTRCIVLHGISQHFPFQFPLFPSHVSHQVNYLPTFLLKNTLQALGRVLYHTDDQFHSKDRSTIPKKEQYQIIRQVLFLTTHTWWRVDRNHSHEINTNDHGNSPEHSKKGVFPRAVFQMQVA